MFKYNYSIVISTSEFWDSRKALSDVYDKRKLNDNESKNSWWRMKFWKFRKEYSRHFVIVPLIRLNSQMKFFFHFHIQCLIGSEVSEKWEIIQHSKIEFWLSLVRFEHHLFLHSLFIYNVAWDIIIREVDKKNAKEMNEQKKLQFNNSKEKFFLIFFYFFIEEEKCQSKEKRERENSF